MYKVLLVDDEVFVRKGLIGLMDWASMQYEICGEAENGQQAFTMIKELNPDLVIVDIRMPVLDGLALIKQVNEELQQKPLFIIVSGYHDFTYAQQAIRYNVHDYILKPVDEKELEATLRKLASALSLRKLASLTGEKQLSESVIDTLINTSCSEQDARQLAQAIDMDVLGEYVYVIAEFHRSKDERGTAWTAIDVSIALSELSDKSKVEIPTYSHNQSQIGMLLNMERLQFSTFHRNHREKYHALQLLISNGLKVDVTLFIGDTVVHIRELAHSYKTAKDAIMYKYAEEAQLVIQASDVRGTPLYYFDVEANIYDTLLEQIEENAELGYKATIDQLFQQFSAQRFAPSAVANSITRSVIGIINIIRQMDGNENDLALLQRILNWQKHYNRLQDLQLVFVQFVSEAALYIAERRSEQSKGGIEKIKKYIDHHYTENINLKSIAATFFMNPVYLGQLFRKTYGVYFNEYLLRLRVEDAKKILRQTDLRMYEVAERVGFQNADYFVSQFEKLEKLTPTDYRNKLRGKNKQV